MTCLDFEVSRSKVKVTTGPNFGQKGEGRNTRRLVVKFYLVGSMSITYTYSTDQGHRTPCGPDLVSGVRPKVSRWLDSHLANTARTRHWQFDMAISGRSSGYVWSPLALLTWCQHFAVICHSVPLSSWLIYTHIYLSLIHIWRCRRRG